MARDKTDKTDRTPAEPIKVRGLLGILDAEARGQAWVMEAPSADYVPGMGFGATKEATRWAWLGLRSEIGRLLSLKKAGRKKEPIQKTKPARRAFEAWIMSVRLQQDLGRAGPSFTNRELIEHCRKKEASLGLTGSQRLFPDNSATLEASLSIGKKLLEIDENWNSKVCEKLLRDLSKTT